MYTIEYTYVSHPGRIRAKHEDNLVCLSGCLPEGNRGTEPVSGWTTSEEPRIFGVFDGMGGEERGEAASLLAAETLRDWDLSERGASLEAYCREANRRITAYTEEEELRCCGATAALLLLDGRGAVACNLGDSRIYRLRDGELTRLSEDHILPMFGGKKGPLIQYLGLPETESLLEPTLAECPVRDRDLYILCTDGLTDMVSEEDIAEFCRNADQPDPFGGVRTLREDEEEDPGERTVRPASGPLEETAKKILAAALNAGGRDNVTFFLIRAAGGSEEKTGKPGFFRRLLQS